MNLMSKPPLGQKPDKPKKKVRKPMRRRSGKAKKRKSASGPLVEPNYADGVRSLPCATCGKPGPSDIHHCKDHPPADQDVYVYLPGYGETSADRDGIPLCKMGGCHWLYHNDKPEFHGRYGPDYQFIPTTRAALPFMEIDF